MGRGGGGGAHNDTLSIDTLSSFLKKTMFVEVIPRMSNVALNPLPTSTLELDCDENVRVTSVLLTMTSSGREVPL